MGTIGDAFIAALSRLFFAWPFFWRGLSALILGVLLAKWFWIFFSPQAVFTSAIPERTTSLEVDRLFGVMQLADTANHGVALPNVQLLGVFAASAGKPGFAILKIDEKRQTGVVEGEEVSPGTRLAEVHADYVVLERAGLKQRVNLENKYAGASSKFSSPEKGVLASRKHN